MVGKALKSISWIWLIPVLILASMLRVYHLGFQSYWIDEMVSLHFAEHPLWRALFWDNTPFFYHLILKFWSHFFGDTETASRSLSVIFSLGSTWTCFRTGQRNGGRNFAVVFALLQATSILSIIYSQETRMYSLLEWAAALHFFYFLEFWNDSRKKGPFVASCIFLVLSHYLGVVILIAEGGFWFLKRKSIPSKKTVAVGIFLGLAFVLLSALHFFSWAHLQWQSFKFNAEPQSHWPTRILWSLVNQSWVSAVGFGILLGCYLRKKCRDLTFDWQTYSLVFCVGVILIFQIGTFVLHRSMFLPRYFIYLLPYWYFWAGKELTEERNPFHLLSGGLILLGTLLALPSAYTPTKSPWRETAEKIGHWPRSFVLTTRTNAIVTPYFRNNHVEVAKWDIENAKLQPVLEALNHYENLWVVENYYGGIQYFDRLTAKLKELHIKCTDESIAPPNVEPVLLLHIQK